MEAIEKYIRKCKIKNLSPETIRNYKYALSIFRKFYADPWDELTQDDVDDFIVCLYDREDIQISTIISRLVAVRAFIRWMQQDDRINHKIKVTIPRNDPPEIQTFETYHIEKIFDACLNTKGHPYVRYRDFTMISLLLDTGMRISELLALSVRDVDIKLQMIEIKKAKNKKPRVVFFTPGVGKILRRFLALRQEILNDKGLAATGLFITEEGTAYSLNTRTFQKNLEKYGKLAGINGIRVSPHTLRHTFSKRFLMAGGDIYTLKDILGHSSLEMTYRYARLFDKNRQQVYQKVMGKYTTHS